MKIHSRQLMPKRVLTRNRNRGGYTMKLELTAPTITKSKAIEISSKINSYMRELSLLGIVTLDFNLTSRRPL